MKVKKAVITAAGASQRGLPLQTLVDRDGTTKTALQIIIEEALSAGIERVCMVIHPDDQSAYANAASTHVRLLHFIPQDQPRGYGDAVSRAQPFVGDDAFLHLVGDHLYVSTSGQTCAQQVVALAEANDCAVSAVQSTRETLLPNYGAIGGKRIPGSQSLYQIERVLEKPTPTEAEQTLIVPGLRAGHYLCFFGIHVLTPGIFQAIEDVGGTQLSPALQLLAQRERYLAYEVDGRRHDIGVKYGLLTAQLALALSGKDRADVLANLVELLGK
jgi:UTP--glucose-1-phosphate uridylyltransferase